MKAQSFFKGLTSLIFLNLLIKPIWMFFIDRQVQIAVGHEEYGRYFAVLNLSYVLFFLSDAGLSNMLNQRVARGERLDIPQLLRIKMVLLTSFMVLCVFLGWLTHISQWSYFFYVILIQVFTSVFVFFRNVITANQAFSADAYLSIVDKTLMTVFCGLILYTGFGPRMDLDLFLQIQAACLGIAAVLAWIFCMRRRFITNAPTEDIEVIVRRITPFAVVILLMSVHYRLDGFLLERIHPRGSLQAGIYASAYRLLDASNMVGYLTAAFLVPFIARHKDEPHVIDEAILHTRHGLMFFVTAIVCFTSMFGPWVQTLLYHTNDRFDTDVIRYCIAALPGYFLVHIYGSVLTATGRFRKLVLLLVVCVTVNVALNLVLIPTYGALGCCYAAMTSQYLCGIGCILLAKKSVALQLHLRSFLLYALLAGILTGLFYFAIETRMNTWLAGSVAAVLTVGLLIAQIKKFNFNSLR